MLQQAGVQGEPTRWGQRAEQEQGRDTAERPGEAHFNTSVQGVFFSSFFLNTGDISSDYHMAAEARRRLAEEGSRPVAALWLSGPLVRREGDLSNALGSLSRVHTLLSVCLSHRFSPLPHGLSL